MSGRILVLAAVLAACLASCEEDVVETGVAPDPCPGGLRKVAFRLDGSRDIVKCVALDTLAAASEPACTLVVFTAPANQRGDEFVRYEGFSADPDQPCGSRIFFAVLQHPQGYYYFDGLTRRAFGSGAGPFATGSYEVVNDQQTVVDAGTFAFHE